MKRLAVISDLHCGSRSGLTPPAWQWREDTIYHDRKKYAEMQRRVWEWYTAEMAALGPIDCLVVNGDAIDGKGERSGGTELLEADRHEQAIMAAECIAQARARQIVIVRGTPYHTGREEDFETVLAEICGAGKVGDHEWIDCEGVIFDFKHKVGSSTIPHGRITPLLKAQLWNALWAEKGLQPRSDVLVRSHVHYFIESTDDSRQVMATPALQGWTKYGGKECEGTTTMGFVRFDCDKGGYTWKTHILNMKWAAAKPFKV